MAPTFGELTESYNWLPADLTKYGGLRGGLDAHFCLAMKNVDIKRNSNQMSCVEQELTTESDIWSRSLQLNQLSGAGACN